MRKTAFLLLTLLALGLMAWAQQEGGFKGTKTAVLSEPSKVGSHILPAGEYKISHVMEGAQHIMVFKKDKQEYRVKCTLQPLNTKAHYTQFTYENDASGQRVLQSMVFEDGTVRHVLE